MTAPILITGGTGTLGRLVVRGLAGAGHPIRVLSRHNAKGQQFPDDVELRLGDLATGEGVDTATKGVDTVVHLAGSAKGDEEKARNLVAAARGAGVRHLVYVSVVGAERVPVLSAVDRAMFGYFGAKRAAELVVENSGLPWTTLRATQFHDLTLTVVAQLAKLPVVPVPAGVRFQPIDSREVAERMVELTLGAPAGLVPDLAGPRVHGMDELVRSYLRATHRHRLILPIRLGGKAYRAIRKGANLAPDRAVGQRSWEEFVAERVNS